ncbi:MAG: hypothetical protein LDL44_01885 [Caenispirillum sp.]|nr:hypothetical protein [Caenispirillum sp.]
MRDLTKPGTESRLRMPNAKPKIFIAHSTETSVGEEILERVREAVVAAGLDPWVDDPRVAPSDLLQETVLENLMLASGGIVIVSRAAVDSRWVPHEAFLMGVRRLFHEDTYPLLLIEEEEGMAEKLYEDYAQLKNIVRMNDRLYVKYDPARIACDVNRVFSPLMALQSGSDPLLLLKRKVLQWVRNSIPYFVRSLAETPLCWVQGLSTARHQWALLPPGGQQAAFTEWLFSGEVNAFGIARVIKALGCSDPLSGARIVRHASLSAIPLHDVEPIRKAISAPLKIVTYKANRREFARQLVRRSMPLVEDDGWYFSRRENGGGVVMARQRRRSAPGDVGPHPWADEADYWLWRGDSQDLYAEEFYCVSVVRAPANDEEASDVEETCRKVPYVLFVLHGSSEDVAHDCSLSANEQEEYVKRLYSAESHFERKGERL